MKKISILYALTIILVSTLMLTISPLFFADSRLLSPHLPPLLSPHPTVDDNMMPDTLEFLLYEEYRMSNGRPIGSNLKSNILSEVPACLTAFSVIDQYGNPKIYAACTGTQTYNARSYPPLYHGDVFPVLDQLYYFESIDKAIKVLEVTGYTQAVILPKGQIILPLTPLDVRPNDLPFPLLCRSSGLLGTNFSAVSLIRINEKTEKYSLSAWICTDYDDVGNVDLDRLGKYVDRFQTMKMYYSGDILINRYLPKQKNRTISATTGFKITKIAPPDPERNRVFKTVEGEKIGRLIGWVELDPTPIPIDANGKPVN